MTTQKFNIAQSIEILERTPLVLETMLKNLPEGWTHNNEGGETWSAYDIIGHLIHGENTDWVVRMEIILSDKKIKPFEKYDRFAQFQNSKGKPLTQLLEEFKLLRQKNIEILKSKNLTEPELNRTGIHPAFGDVTLRQLIAAWVVHDLGHIGQISRVMAKQYKAEVGPWTEYLRILST